MIKFFRKIRQKLLSENRFSKYLIYAIGEIILVVIGILIALQINSWNQNKNDKVLEQQYYCRLLEDIRQDYANYKNSLSLLNSKISGSNELLARLQDKSMPLDSIAPFIMKSIKYSIRDVSATTNAFEDIKSSGNLNLIRDLSLKNDLTLYFETLLSVNSVMESNGKAITQQRLFSHEDLINSGWLQLLEDFGGLDKNKVDFRKLKAQVNFTDEMRLKMTNDAIFYQAINARNKNLLVSIEGNILTMIKKLESKCSTDNQ